MRLCYKITKKQLIYLKVRIVDLFTTLLFIKKLVFSTDFTDKTIAGK